VATNDSKKTPEKLRPISSGGPDAILAALYRKILLELGINNTKFNLLMEKYLNDHRNMVPQNSFDRSSTRGNLKKELLKLTMSWKAICKGIRFLHVYKFEVRLTLYHQNKQVTSHAIMANLDDVQDDEGLL